MADPRRRTRCRRRHDSNIARSRTLTRWSSQERCSPVTRLLSMNSPQRWAVAASRSPHRPRPVRSRTGRRYVVSRIWPTVVRESTNSWPKAVRAGTIGVRRRAFRRSLRVVGGRRRVPAFRQSPPGIPPARKGSGDPTTTAHTNRPAQRPPGRPLISRCVISPVLSPVSRVPRQPSPRPTPVVRFESNNR